MTWYVPPLVVDQKGELISGGIPPPTSSELQDAVRRESIALNLQHGDTLFIHGTIPACGIIFWVRMIPDGYLQTISGEYPKPRWRLVLIDSRNGTVIETGKEV